MNQAADIGNKASSEGPGEKAAAAASGAASAQAVIAWLLDRARHTTGRTTALLSQLCERLVASGVPLDRASLHVRQLHPMFAARTLLWLSESGGSVEVDRQHGVQNTAMFLRSPVKPIYEGGEAIRRRLIDPDCPMDYPVLEDLRAQSYTDYTIRPLLFSGHRPMAIGFSTKHPEGFSEAQIETLEAVLSPLAAVLELHEQQRTARLLMDTYIGRSAGERVLGGAIRRGYGEIIPAAIWYCDLRGFSSLSEEIELDSLISTLNDYFDHVGAAIEAAGGEILKFIGDGILAIFPLENTDKTAGARASGKALEAANRALGELEDLNRKRREEGKPEIRYGISLHIGDVMYGNVGAKARLDFTVIGPAVNLTCRLENLTRDVEPPLVLSQAFAQCCGRSVKSLGRFKLKGIAAEQEAFTLSACKVRDNRG
ncbi:MAG: adenylate/guanylate cyclase domain-containing protein [Rhodovibrionaceae bacterium]|nr:adenylate/guanylate cyclase domain-containing protein [Rhodovibrionaceae bacterium]